MWCIQIWRYYMHLYIVTIMYSERHRVLLTYLRAERAVPTLELLHTFDAIATHFEAETGLASLRADVATINVHLEKLGFKIESLNHDDESFHVFINSRSDAAIQQATLYTPTELEAIQALVDVLVDRKSVPVSEATARLQSVTKRSSEVLLELLCAEWLHIKDNRVGLGVAAIAELRPYLVERFGIKSFEDPLGKLMVCKVCDGLVFSGKLCKNCPTFFHEKCLGLFQRTKEDCDCGAPITETAEVGSE